MLWTGKPIITKTFGEDTYDVPDAGFAGPWSFRVEDRYHHPMSPGTMISVSAAGALIDGNANITMGDTFYSGNGTTDFTIIISDAAPHDLDPNPAPSVLYVTVEHPVYGTYKYMLASGVIN
jgi:hypothetical protein